MLNERDLKVIEFINMVELCNRKQIKDLFFKDTHENICMRRLTKLYELGYFERVKLNGNQWFYYTNKKPSARLLNHDLLITEVVTNMMINNVEIIEYQKSFMIGNIISDAYIRYKINDKVKHLVLEVQLSNKIKDCVMKYENFKELIIENNLRSLGTVPKILVVSDLKDKIELRKYKVKYCSTNLNDLMEVL